VKRWTIEDAPSAETIGEIAATLKAGGVVLMPTDTIYGLHAIPSSSSRVADLKARDENKRFVTIAASAAQAETLGVRVPQVVRELWPAPLTAILAQNEATIAIRVPDLAWLRSLLDRTGPLVSTSANRSGEPPITSPEQLATGLRDVLDGIVDAGVREGKPSAIVDFTGAAPKVTREGDFAFTQLLRKTLRKSL
jgi:tRNA threonylcarbamoyl adenosine modification protein (Sua5/YciO/YrdC/YwlC family)